MGATIDVGLARTSGQFAGACHADLHSGSNAPVGAWVAGSMPGVLPFLAEGGVQPAQALSHGQDASIMAHEALSAHTRGAGSPGFLILRQAGLTKVVRLTALRVLQQRTDHRTIVGHGSNEGYRHACVAIAAVATAAAAAEVAAICIATVAVATNRCRRDSLLAAVCAACAGWYSTVL